MKLNDALKAGFLVVFALLALTLTSQAALAYNDPYGHSTRTNAGWDNTIGSYYQQSSTYSYGFSGGYAYDYAYPARAGGFYGWGTEYLVGLRSPYWSTLPPVHYTNFYAPTCGWGCYFPGYGYPRATASQFPYRSRLGGVFGY